MRVPRLAVVILVLAVAIGCGGNDNSPTGPSASASFSGTWTGTIGSATQVRWTATQSGGSVAGPVVLTSPVTNIVVTGVLTAAISGTTVSSLVLTVPPGGVAGFPNCSIAGSGSGTANATASSISGTMTQTFTGCQGLVTGSSTDTIVLNKQSVEVEKWKSGEVEK